MICLVSFFVGPGWVITFAFEGILHTNSIFGEEIALLFQNLSGRFLVINPFCEEFYRCIAKVDFINLYLLQIH